MNKKSFFKSKITYVIFLFSFIGYSQIEFKEPIDFPTPSSAFEFLKYGDIPISEYSGQAAINIPIYNITIDNVSLPIGINYVTGGLKVSQEASIVGLGWDFTLPSIIQTINDDDDYARSSKHKKMPDYVGSPIFPTLGALHPNVSNNLSGDPYSGTPGYQDYPLYFISSGDFIVSNDSYITSPTSGNYYNEIYNYSYDTEPDVFTLNLDGNKIVMTTVSCGSSSYSNCEDLDIKIINGQEEYKVEKIIETNINEELYIKGFKIIDAKSTKYFFDVIDEIFTSSLSTGHLTLYNTGSGSEISSKIFKLSKIITSKGNEIIINYNSFTFQELPKISQKFYRKMSNTAYSSAFPYGEFDVSDFYTFTPSAPTYSNYFKNNNSTSASSNSSFLQTGNFNYVSSITTSKENINFNYSLRVDFEGMKKLDNIIIKDYNNTPYKQFDFSYGYYDSDSNFYGTTEFENKRLKLNSVQEIGKPSYIFEYNTIKLPNKNSHAIDYWGYFNGHNNDSFTPPLSELGYPQYNDKASNDFHSNLNYTKACSLKKIQYPTGGTSEFIYELHQFDNLFYTTQPTAVTSGGGLRIQKKITKSNNIDIPIQTTYVYNGGKIINKISLAKTFTERNLMIAIGPVDGYYEFNTYTTAVLLISSNNTYGNFGAIHSRGNSVGYDSVEIINSLGENGKTVKLFTNESPEIYNPNGSRFFNPVYIYDRTNKKNGTLLEEVFYDNSQNLIRKNEYSYSVVQEPNYNVTHHYGLNVSTHKTSVFPQGIHSSYPVDIFSNFMLTFYPIFDCSTLFTGVTTTEYDQNSLSLVSSNNILLNSKNQPTSKSNTIVGGAESTTNFGYNIVSGSGITADDNFHGIPYRSSSGYDGGNYFLDKYFHYKKYPEYNNGILLENKWKCSRGAYPPYDDEGCIKTSFNKYDIRGNIVEYQIEHTNPVTIIWGYNKNYPIAKIENATYSEISAQISTLQGLSDADNDTTVGSTGNEGALRAALNNLRNLPTLSDAFITTYTYDPLIGVTSITDAIGQTIYYYYDNSNRLKYVIDKDGKVLSKNEYHYKTQ